MTLPSATFTPSTAATAGRTDAGIGFRAVSPLPASSSPKPDAARTETSTPVETSWKRVSKLWEMVSVRM